MANILDNSGNDRLSPAGAPEDETSGLGELLRHARERRGLTLEQISNETKIPRRHLEAIERDNLAAVPGGFYRRAQIRTFARVVGLDQGLVVARLEPKLKGPAPRDAVPDTSTAHGPAFSGRRLLIAIGVGVAAVVLVRSIGRQPQPVRDAQERAAADSPAAVTSPDPERLGDVVVATSQRTPPNPDPTPPAISEDRLPAATERPGAAASAGANGGAAVTEPPRPAAEPVTELVVTTQPPGARVTVDGIGWGSTPATIRFLPAGSKRIRVIKDGYGSEERVVNLVEGRRSTVNIPLPGAP
jgi:cytoskeletal protein RodZ